MQGLAERILNAADRLKEYGGVDEDEVTQAVACELAIDRVRDPESRYMRWVYPAWLCEQVHTVLNERW